MWGGWCTRCRHSQTTARAAGGGEAHAGEAHAAAGGGEAHAPLIEATAAHTTLSIDGGTKNLGYAVVRETVAPLFSGDASAVLTSAAPLDAHNEQMNAIFSDDYAMPDLDLE